MSKMKFHCNSYLDMTLKIVTSLQLIANKLNINNRYRKCWKNLEGVTESVKRKTLVINFRSKTLHLKFERLKMAGREGVMVEWRGLCFSEI